MSYMLMFQVVSGVVVEDHGLLKASWQDWGKGAV